MAEFELNGALRRFYAEVEADKQPDFSGVQQDAWV